MVSFSAVRRPLTQGVRWLMNLEQITIKTVTQNMKAKLPLALIVCIVAQTVFAQPKLDLLKAASIGSARAFVSGTTSEDWIAQEETLKFPGLLRREELDAGNPLATYAAMLDLELGGCNATSSAR